MTAWSTEGTSAHDDQNKRGARLFLSTARDHGSFCHMAALLADFHVKVKEILNHNLNKMVPALQSHFLLFISRSTLEGY